MPAVLSVDLAMKTRNIGICILRQGKSWVASFISPAQWNLHDPLPPTTLADAIYEFCIREDVAIVLVDGPQGWKDPESELPYCRQCEKAVNTPAKTGTRGIVRPAPYTAFVEFSISVFKRLTERGARLASTAELEAGRELLALECFPNAAWKKLGIRPLPAKARHVAADITDRLNELKGRFDIELPRTPPTHDELQALVTAMAGKAILEHRPEGYAAQGVPPSIKGDTIVEGFIVNPAVRTIRVFQYGSNTLPARLNGPNRLGGRAQSCGLAQTIEGLDIAFDVYSQSNGCAASDLIAVNGRRAWGVLYEIPDGFVFDRRPDGQKTLAQIEGSRYEPREIGVVDSKGKELRAWTFVVKESERRVGLATSAAYVSWIVYGLRQHNAPEDYVCHVIEIAKETNRQAVESASEQLRLIENI